MDATRHDKMYLLREMFDTKLEETGSVRHYLAEMDDLATKFCMCGEERAPPERHWKPVPP